jgi:hypothetical protein
VNLCLPRAASIRQEGPYLPLLRRRPARPWPSKSLRRRPRACSAVSLESVLTLRGDPVSGSPPYEARVMLDTAPPGRGSPFSGKRSTVPGLRRARPTSIGPTL